jgi:hypothetical protein
VDGSYYENIIFAKPWRVGANHQDHGKEKWKKEKYSQEELADIEAWANI